MDDINQAQIPNGSKKAVVHDPFLADELDVLEAVASLEKKYGKKILTEEQRGKLALRDGKVKNDQITHEDISKLANVITEGLWMDAEHDGAKMYSKEGWERLGNNDKRQVGFLTFIMNYGLSPDTFKSELIKRMMMGGHGK